MVTAVQHVRRMRGGAQSQMMRADDGNYYVVKFQNNPQHVRVLANELLATRLAECIGLPVAVPEVVEVGGWLIEHTPELRVELAGQSLRCVPGLQFGSRYLVDPLAGQVFDYIPDELLERVKNMDAFAGVLAFDKWTCNANGRQAAFWRKSRERRYAAAFIDQGYCFNAGEWTFPDSPLRGVYMRNAVYAGVSGWASFEPWLERIEEFGEKTLWQCAEGIPPEWYGADWEALERLCEMLLKRRTRVRELIESFRDSSRAPFPNWGGSRQPSAISRQERPVIQ
ncbi:MAG TPA: HipA family kinase [Terriglobales bacterium]|nr:HipA family kinase [Terriglobales bacterium]